MHPGVAFHLAQVAAAVDVASHMGGSQDVDPGVAGDDGRGAVAAAEDGVVDVAVVGGYAEGAAASGVGCHEAAGVDALVDVGGGARAAAGVGADNDGDVAQHTRLLAVAAAEDIAQRVGAAGGANGATDDVDSHVAADGAYVVRAAEDASNHVAGAHDDVHMAALLAVRAAEDPAGHRAAQDVDMGARAIDVSVVAAAVDIARDVGAVGYDDGGTDDTADGGVFARGLAVAAAGAEEVAAARVADVRVVYTVLQRGAAAEVEVGAAAEVAAVGHLGAVGSARNPSAYGAAGDDEAAAATGGGVLGGAVYAAADGAAVDAQAYHQLGGVDIGAVVLVHAAGDGGEDTALDGHAARALIVQVVRGAGAHVEPLAAAIRFAEGAGIVLAALDEVGVLVGVAVGLAAVLGIVAAFDVAQDEAAVVAAAAIVVAAQHGVHQQGMVVEAPLAGEGHIAVVATLDAHPYVHRLRGMGVVAEEGAEGLAARGAAQVATQHQEVVAHIEGVARTMHGEVLELGVAQAGEVLTYRHRGDMVGTAVGRGGGDGGGIGVGLHVAGRGAEEHQVALVGIGARGVGAGRVEGGGGSEDEGTRPHGLEVDLHAVLRGRVEPQLLLGIDHSSLRHRRAFGRIGIEPATDEPLDAPLVEAAPAGVATAVGGTYRERIGDGLITARSIGGCHRYGLLAVQALEGFIIYVRIFTRSVDADGHGRGMHVAVGRARGGGRVAAVHGVGAVGKISYFYIRWIEAADGRGRVAVVTPGVRFAVVESYGIALRRSKQWQQGK